MGRIINMTKETHENGSFTMHPIEGIASTIKEFVEQWGPDPLPGPARIDLDRYKDGEKDVDEEQVGQPRILAGKNGPYVRVYSFGFRHFEAGQSHPTTLLGCVQQVKQQGENTLDFRPKLPRRRTQQATAGASSGS